MLFTVRHDIIYVIQYLKNKVVLTNLLTIVLVTTNYEKYIIESVFL